METWGVLFLGVIAVAAAVQTAFLVLLARSGLRLTRRVEEIQRQIDRDIRPSLDSLNRFTRNVEEISDRAVLQARRLDQMLTHTLERIEEATNALRRVTERPLSVLVDVVAFLKGLRRGLDVYHQLRGLDRQHRPASRRYAEDDEHLFI